LGTPEKFKKVSKSCQPSSFVVGVTEKMGKGLMRIFFFDEKSGLPFIIFFSLSNSWFFY